MNTIPITKIHPFEEHPYKVLDNEEMNELIQSVQQHGILSPLIVRPIEGKTDEYEIISGHADFEQHKRQGLRKSLPLFMP